MTSTARESDPTESPTSLSDHRLPVPDRWGGSHFSNAALTSSGGELQITMGGQYRLAEGKIMSGPIDHGNGDTFHARFGRRDLPEQERFGLLQLTSRHQRGLHFLQIALHNDTGPGYVLRVTAIANNVRRRR